MKILYKPEAKHPETELRENITRNIKDEAALKKSEPHCPTLHCLYIPLLETSYSPIPHRFTLLCVTLHRLALHCPKLFSETFHCMTSRCPKSYCSASRHLTLHCSTLFCVMLHSWYYTNQRYTVCIAILTSHCPTLHCLRSHCQTFS